MKGGVIPLLAAATLATGGQLETQHAIEAGIPISERFHLVIHSRGRTQPRDLGPYQGRIGPIFEYTAAKRLTVVGGYYYTIQKSEDNDIRGNHRIFGGLQSTFAKVGAAELSGRSLIERFTGNAPAYNRYRHRFRAATALPLGPYVGVELLHDAQGWRSTRYSAGLRWKLRGKTELDTGYFFEPRRADVGPPRHMILTSVHFHFTRGMNSDPDF